MNQGGEGKMEGIRNIKPATSFAQNTHFETYTELNHYSEEVSGPWVNENLIAWLQKISSLTFSFWDLAALSSLIDQPAAAVEFE